MVERQSLYVLSLSHGDHTAPANDTRLPEMN